MKLKKLVICLMMCLMMPFISVISTSAMNITEKNYSTNQKVMILSDDEADDEESGFLDTLSNIWESVKKIVSAISGTSDNLAKGVITEMFGTMSDYINSAFDNIVDVMDYNAGLNMLQGSYAYYINRVLGVITAGAFSLSSIFWCLSMVKTAFRYEEFTQKKAFTLVGGLLFNSVLIFNSARICKWIANFESGLASRVLGIRSTTLIGFMPDFSSYDLELGEGANIPFVQFFVDLFFGIVSCFPVMLAFFALLVVFMLIYIKLIIRQLELACMTSISPIFFGCLIGEVTRPFFKNFIVTFLSVAFETLFMAVTLILGSAYLTTEFNTDLTVGDLTLASVACVAVGIMALRPPKCLTNLIRS